MLKFYSQKYHDGSEFLVLKSLAYFDDAEEEEMPNMLNKISWTEVKKQINAILKKYCKDLESKS